MTLNEEVTLVVIITTKPGKGEQFREMSEQGYNSFKDSEKDCIQFLFHSEEQNAEGEQRHVLVERYTNAAALKLHRENPAHGELMRKLGELDLLATTPIMYEGSATFGHAQVQAL